MTRFRTFLRHSSYLLGSKLVSRLLYTVFVVFAASRLGPELFGILAFAMAVTELLSWIGDLGITRYGARELLKAKEDRSQLNGQILTLQLFTSLVFSSIALVAVLAWQPPYPKTQLLLMGLVAVMLSGILNASESALIATQNFFYSALLAFAGRLIYITAGFVLLLRGFSVVPLMGAFLVAASVEAGLRLLVIVRMANGFSFRFSLRRLRDMVLASLPFAVAAIAGVVFSQIGVVALEFLKGDSEVGIYSMAYSLFVPFVWLAVTLSKVTMPGLAELYRLDLTAVRYNYRQWYRFLVMSGIPVAVTATLLARPVISYLPESYEQSATVLIILMWTAPLALISSLEMNIMQITGREKAAARILVAATVATVALDFVFVPLFGVIGAAAVALAGTIVREVQAYEEVRKNFFLRKHYLSLLAKPALGGVAMALAAWFAWRAGPWLATVLGLLTYVLVIIATRAVRLSEIRTLARG